MTDVAISKVNEKMHISSKNGDSMVTAATKMSAVYAENLGFLDRINELTAGKTKLSEEEANNLIDLINKQKEAGTLTEKQARSLKDVVGNYKSAKNVVGNLVGRVSNIVKQNRLLAKSFGTSEKALGKIDDNYQDIKTQQEKVKVAATNWKNILNSTISVLGNIANKGMSIGSIF
jgi:septation ring formation regulator EzrA